jgi:GAF domain-containing protein
VYTAEERHFSQLEIDLLKAVAAQAAAAIENARLLTEALEAEALEKQVAMAIEVQQRMICRKLFGIPDCQFVPQGFFCDLIFRQGLYDFVVNQQSVNVQ